MGNFKIYNPDEDIDDYGEKLEYKIGVGEAEGGLVKVYMASVGVAKVSINELLLNKESKTLLEKLIAEATNNAFDKLAEMAETDDNNGNN